jgi:hypothetical protein
LTRPCRTIGVVYAAATERGASSGHEDREAPPPVTDGRTRIFEL